MIDFGDPITKFLFIPFVTISALRLGQYWLSYGRLAFHKNPKEGVAHNPVSVIICARNEEKNLRKYLAETLEQNYSDYEVVVVNDCSWDETGEYLESVAKENKRLKVVTIKEQEKYRHGKKFALTLGIKAATNDVLLMTDADCRPVGKDWIARMQSGFSNGTEIVLGYGAYMKKNGFLNKLIRFDTFTIAMQYLSAVIGKNAYMGVGRNLAYRKSLFFRNKGFAKHNHVVSGDDDLFVNENANKSNTKIEVHPDAFTSSVPKESFGDWFKQKRRHQSTGKYYKGKHKFNLFMGWFISFLFYGTLISLFVLKFDWRILLSLYGLVLLLLLPIVWKCARQLQEKDLVWMYPVLDPLQTFIQPVFYISNLFTKQKAWK